MLIRRIKIEDAGKYLSMLKKLDNETKYMMYEPDERCTTIPEVQDYIKSMNSTNSLLLVAEENAEIIGFLSAERGFANRIKHSAYIVVGILGEYRGKKIGTKLFEELEKWAESNGIYRLELTVMTHNEGAIKLYKRMGFKVEGIKEKSLIVDEDFVNEYYMAKIL
jgi:ribosomal protein S18 acetylase RimI-like enzyme